MKSASGSVAVALAIAAVCTALPSLTNAASDSDRLSTPPQGQSAVEGPRAGSSSGTSLVDLRWLGRPVYSSDQKYLGDVAALNEDDQHEFYVDLGGFLALGETRIIRISSDQLLEVDDDRIVLRLTEPEARSLPTPDSQQAQDL
jgi:hypothetical protein